MVTIEVELVMANEASKEALWLSSSTLNNIRLALHNDKQRLIALAYNMVFHTKAKYVGVCQLYAPSTNL